jgi:hypothetical protein
MPGPESAAISSRPTATPSVTNNLKTPDHPIKRPSLRKITLQTRSSSKKSVTAISIFDKEDATESPDLSPTTPPDDSVTFGPKNRNFAQASTPKSSEVKPCKIRKPTPEASTATTSELQDALLQDTPSKGSRYPSRKKPRISLEGRPKPSIVGSHDLHVPASSDPRQRASSAPSLPTNRKSHQKDDRQDEDSEQRGIPCTWVSSQETVSEADTQCPAEDPEHTFDQDEGSASPQDTEMPKSAGPDPHEGGESSRFSAFGKKKEQREINWIIYNCILGKGKIGPPSSKKVGWIYVFVLPEDEPNHVKIGMTEREPGKRQEELERCGFMLHEADDEFKNAFAHYAIVEKLVQYTLSNERKKFLCYPCGKNNRPKVHGEWFETNQETALKSIKLWRDWIIQQEPFDKKGYLSEYWRWKAEKLKTTLNNVDWEDWTQPSREEYKIFKMEEYGDEYTVVRELKAHFARKDLWFCFCGSVMINILYMYFGRVGAACFIVALMIL